MYHRYGRHGPHAWRRWREKRFARHPTDVIHVAHVAIVQLHLSLTHTERVIFIVDSDIYDPNKGSNGADTTKSLSGRKEPLLLYADNDARRYTERVFEQPEGLPPREGTQRYAKLLGNQRIDECIDSGKDLPWETTEDAHKAYVTRFMNIYDNKIASLEASVPDKETWNIQKIARFDKKRDGDSLLASDLLIYQAIIRVKEYLAPLSPLQIHDLERIKRAAKLYEDEYRDYIYDPALEKEEHRPNGFNQFPGYPN
jgi:hypothetical protein